MGTLPAHMLSTGPARRERQKRTGQLSYLLIHGVLLVISFAFLTPLLLVVISSFTPEDALNRFGYSLIPHGFTLDAYAFLFNDSTQLMYSYGVSIFVTVIGTLLGLLIMSLMAYALSRRHFALRRPLSFYVLFTLLFSGGLVPLYILVTQYLHLQDTLMALILPNLVAPWYVLLLRTYFLALPKDLVEAAKIDGASEWRIFFQIVVPLSQPALATVGLFTALLYWNDWYLALLFINDPHLLPLQYLLYQISTNIQIISTHSHLSGMRVPLHSVEMATAVLAIGPIVFIFLFVQKYFVRGLTLGGIKGE